MEVRAENHINSYEIVSYDHIDSIYDEDQSPVTADASATAVATAIQQENIIAKVLRESNTLHCYEVEDSANEVTLQQPLASENRVILPLIYKKGFFYAPDSYLESFPHEILLERGLPIDSWREWMTKLNRTIGKDLCADVRLCGVACLTCFACLLSVSTCGCCCLCFAGIVKCCIPKSCQNSCIRTMNAYEILKQRFCDEFNEEILQHYGLYCKLQHSSCKKMIVTPNQILPTAKYRNQVVGWMVLATTPEEIEVLKRENFLFEYDADTFLHKEVRKLQQWSTN